MSELTPDQERRYNRQLIMPEIGQEGQVRLRASSVLVVGTGGLGSPVLFYLAGAGVGRLGILDDDQVDLSNLQRQILHRTDGLGMDKVESARQALQRLNPDVALDLHKCRLTEENASSLIAPYDVVVGAVDNLATRYVLNAACVMMRKPLVEAGVSGFSGMATTIIPTKTPCYHCLFPRPEAGLQEPRYKGIIGALAGLMGTIEALETIKLLLGQGELLTGRLLFVDSLSMGFREIDVERNPECPICKDENGTTRSPSRASPNDH